MKLICVHPYFFKKQQELTISKIYTIPKWVTKELTSFGGYIVLNDLGMEQEYSDYFLIPLCDFRENRLNIIL